MVRTASVLMNFNLMEKSFMYKLLLKTFCKAADRTTEGEERGGGGKKKKKLCEARTFCRRILIYELFTYEYALMIS